MLLSTKGDYGVRGNDRISRNTRARGRCNALTLLAAARSPSRTLTTCWRSCAAMASFAAREVPAVGTSWRCRRDDICLLHVLESLEGSLAPIQCVGDEVLEEDTLCGQQWVWQDVYGYMRERLANVSLAELVQHEHEHARQRDVALNYNI